jgi:hypothetical protein
MKPRIRVKPAAGHYIITAAIVAIPWIALQTAIAQTLATIYSGVVLPSVTVSPGTGADDTARIQDAIDRGMGAIRFSPGVYNLYGPLHLRGNRSYIGEGSWDSTHGSVLLQHSPGAPIFSVDGQVYSVTIVGLTFDGVPGANAKGIASGNPSALLATSSIRDSYFLTTLTECIDVAMVLTRIERNQFGVNGSWIGPKHRHIHSVDPVNEGQSNANWVVGNLFRSAQGTESVLFESGVQLHLIGNDFEANDSDTTLEINGMFQAVIQGNYFEGNRGDALMHFANSRHSPSGSGNYIVRLDNNYYNMQRCASNGCQPIYNNFVFKLDGNSSGGRLTVTTVYMGYETGTHFTHSDGTAADLTDPAVAAICNSSRMGIYLQITGPFYIPDYKGTETNGCK